MLFTQLVTMQFPMPEGLRKRWLASIFMYRGCGFPANGGLFGFPAKNSHGQSVHHLRPSHFQVSFFLWQLTICILQAKLCLFPHVSLHVRSACMFLHRLVASPNESPSQSWFLGISSVQIQITYHDIHSLAPEVF